MNRYIIASYIFYLLISRLKKKAEVLLGDMSAASGSPGKRRDMDIMKLMCVSMCRVYVSPLPV